MNAGPLIFLIALIALFWFLLIRPQRRRQAAHRNLIEQLQPGNEVVTAGGMFGTLQSVADDHVIVEIAPGTQVRFAKDAVTGVVRKEEPAASEAENPG